VERFALFSIFGDRIEWKVEKSRKSALAKTRFFLYLYRLAADATDISCRL
jgi:hypothetical protein